MTELEQMTPNQRRALDAGLAALDTMAATWAAEVKLFEIAKHFASISDPDERATRIAAMVRQGFSEGAYRCYLDHKDACAKQAARIAELEAQTKQAMMWTLIGQGLPTEPGDYLVMLEPDNEWEIRSTAPIMVEFDAFTSMPKAFTYHDGWHTEHQNITASVTAYMRVPAGPAALLKGGTAQ
jgi:hypothetical protein